MVTEEIERKHYAILGLKRDCSAADIKAAYRSKVKDFHPDLGGDPEVFLQVAEAYTILSDPEKRREYDATGEVDGFNALAFQKSVIETLASIMDSVIEQSLAERVALTDLFLIQTMETALSAALQAARKALSYKDETMTGLLDLRRRIKRHGEGENVFIGIIDRKLAVIGKEVSTLKRDVKTLERCTEEMERYDDAAELIRTMQASAWPASPSSSHGGYFGMMRFGL